MCIKLFLVVINYQSCVCEGEKREVWTIYMSSHKFIRRKSVNKNHQSIIVQKCERCTLHVSLSLCILKNFYFERVNLCHYFYLSL